MIYGVFQLRAESCPMPWGGTILVQFHNCDGEKRWRSISHDDLCGSGKTGYTQDFFTECDGNITTQSYPEVVVYGQVIGEIYVESVRVWSDKGQ